MKRSRTNVAAVLAMGLLTLSAGSVFACGGGGGGNRGGGGFGGGFGGVVSRHSGNLGGVYNRPSSQNRLRGEVCESTGAYSSSRQQYSGQAHEPFHSSYVVQPGDSFYTVSLKEYGTSANADHIARFNRLAPNDALVLGQRLLMPSISASGKLTQSRAPAAEGTSTGQVAGNGSPVTENFSTGRTGTPAQAASASKVAVEESLARIAVGSTLAVDGVVLGDEAGVARLRVSGIAFPVEVIEWSNTTARIRLPQLNVTAATRGEIEILRADGSVASKSSVELTAPADRLALGN